VEHVWDFRALAEQLLAAPLPTRWAHTQGVGREAERIAFIVGDDADLLIQAAWLHDIGYAPDLNKAGFHPLDGARYLRDEVRADALLCRLVAHHSFALNEARRRGLAEQLAEEFPPVQGLLLDALTCCDMTTSPTGEPVTVEARLDEIASRYGEGDIVAESIAESREAILASVQAVQSTIADTPSSD
jgi:hypothetical protein